MIVEDESVVPDDALEGLLHRDDALLEASEVSLGTFQAIETPVHVRLQLIDRHRFW